MITIDQIIEAATALVEASIADDASGLLGLATVRKRDELRMLIFKWKAQDEDAVTAGVVERETIERCADVPGNLIRVLNLLMAGQNCVSEMTETLRQIQNNIHALPRLYAEEPQK